jgi:hypothetical protein
MPGVFGVRFAIDRTRCEPWCSPDSRPEKPLPEANVEEPQSGERTDLGRCVMVGSENNQYSALFSGVAA